MGVERATSALRQHCIKDSHLVYFGPFIFLAYCVQMMPKACYDCILHNVAMICMLRTCISYNSIKSMFLTPQKMKHKVATGHGVLESSYKVDDAKIPLQGIGQRNGAGPSGWAVISSPLFETVRSSSLRRTSFPACHMISFL